MQSTNISAIWRWVLYYYFYYIVLYTNNSIEYDRYSHLFIVSSPSISPKTVPKVPEEELPIFDDLDSLYDPKRPQIIKNSRKRTSEDDNISFRANKKIKIVIYDLVN